MVTEAELYRSKKFAAFNLRKDLFQHAQKIFLGDNITDGKDEVVEAVKRIEDLAEEVGAGLPQWTVRLSLWVAFVKLKAEAEAGRTASSVIARGPTPSCGENGSDCQSEIGNAAKPEHAQ